MAEARTRIPVPDAQARIVLQESGNCCAFPGCDQTLTIEAADGSVAVGEIAHIVAASRQGPRGDAEVADPDRGDARNLLLLCEPHHKLIDRLPRVYSVAVLRRMKEDHARRIAEKLQRKRPDVGPEPVQETLQSTLLPLTHLPTRIYSAPVRLPTDDPAEIRKEIVYPEDRSERVVFIVRERRLLSFHDLREYAGPFTNIVSPNDTEQLDSGTFLASPDMARWYMELLNRSLAGFCHLRGLRHDREHQRFYFPPQDGGQERTVTYKTAGGQTRKRKVAWNPKRKATGEGKRFWIHLAVSLRFERVAPRQWVLSIRPERHITTDGVTPLQGKAVGKRVTSLKSRLYNWQYLAEVNFWQEFLSNGAPNMIVHLGDRQSIVAEAALVPIPIRWPGVPNDVKVFDASKDDHDLFSFAELQEAISGLEDKYDEGVDVDDDEEGSLDE